MASSIDLASLRKELGVSQKSMAQRLHCSQSFLSAVERGRAFFPSSKIQMLIHVYGPGIKDFIFDTKDPARMTNAKMTGTDPGVSKDNDTAHNHFDSEAVAQLLRIFHTHEHKEENHNHELHHQKMDEMQQRLVKLLDRNDTLAERNTTLQERLDHITAKHIEDRNEIYRLRELLIKHNIPH